MCVQLQSPCSLHSTVHIQCNLSWFRELTSLLQSNLHISLLIPILWSTDSFGQNKNFLCQWNKELGPERYMYQCGCIKIYVPVWLPRLLSGKRICLPMQETRVRSLGWKISWSREWQPIPVFLPGKSHGQRSLVGYSPQGRKELDTTEWLHFHYPVGDSFGLSA